MQTNRVKKIVPVLNWLVITIFVFYQFSLQFVGSVFHHKWEQDFHLTNVGVSQLSSIFFLSYLLCQVPAGIIYNRYKVKYVMISAALLLAAGCIGLGVAPTFYWALLARVVMGIASAFGFVGILYICTVWFRPNYFSFMLSLSEACSMIVLMFSITGLSYVLMHFSWRAIMVSSGVGAILLAVLTFFIVGERSSQMKKKKTNRQSWLSVFKKIPRVLTNKQIWIASLYGFFTFSVISAFNALWGIAFLEKTYGFDRVLSSQITNMILLGFAVGCPLNGWLASRLGCCKPLMYCGSVVSLIMMMYIIFIPGLPHAILYVTYTLIGLFSSSYIHSYSLMKKVASRDVRAESLAVGNMILMLCAPFFQILIGALLDNHFFGLASSEAMQYRLAMSTLPLGLFFSFVLVFYVKER
jgi:MFS family permease